SYAPTLLLHRSPPHLHPHSFPTRRSSDLARGTAKLDIIAQLPLLLNGLPAITRKSLAKEIPPAQDTLHYLVYKSDIFTDGVYLLDRKSTRLNSSHEWISYAVFCLKNKIKT